MSRVLILGATSSIARAIAAELASQGASLFLAGRDREELKRVAADLAVRYGAPVPTGLLEASILDSHPDFIKGVIQTLGGIDGVVFAIGSLGEQPVDSHRVAPALRLMEINLVSAISLLTPLADILETQGSGFIIGIGSVAGDRGRQSNYVYGAAKGGLAIYLAGLRNRLERSAVRVYTLKLGFVDTAMTFGMKGLFLVASPQQIGRSAAAVLKKGSGTYYLPWFWRLIMLVICLIPERIFKRLSL